MLTKWGKRLLAGALFNGMTKGAIPFTTCDGQQVYGTRASGYGFPFETRYRVWQDKFVVSDASSNDAGFMLGAGTAAENEDSYWLDNPYLAGSGISATSVIQDPILDAQSNTVTYTMLITVTNSSAETKTITEVALRSTADASTTVLDTGRYKTVLIDRTVLATPIDIPPNGSATIEYAITLDLSE